MSLVRYAGPVRALRGAVGRLLPDGRARLRGVARTVPAGDLVQPLWWALADGAWSGPFTSYGAAQRWLVELLTVWRATDVIGQVLATDASEAGSDWYVDGCRVRLVPGGEARPVA